MASDVYMDGELLGFVDRPRDFIESIKEEKRNSKEFYTINAYYDEKEDKVLLSIDRGRIRRPLIIVKDAKPLLTKEHIEKLKSGELTFTNLIEQGVIEYLDSLEEEGALIAINQEDLTKEHTHLEIDPIAIFGTVSAMVPFINFESSSRSLRGSKSQKQAIGMYALNYNARVDTNVNLLTYPQRPIVHSFTQKYIGRPRIFGQNLVVAVLNFEGYNLEDSIVVNKASLERGMGRSIFFRPYEAERLRYAGGQKDEITLPEKESEGYTEEYDYRYLGEDGIVSPEVEVTAGDIIIGKTSPPRFLEKLDLFSGQANIRRDTSVRIRHGEEGVVDRVFITEGEEGDILVKVKVRDHRIPELGDKFSTRSGQKGVIGRIVPQEDIPYTADGITPDIIFSPNSILKRMTVNYLLEALGGRVGALSAREIDSTAFSSENSEALRKELLTLGFRDDGLQTMYDAKTGKLMQSRIFTGIMYYERLVHQTKGKIQARGRGPIQLLTRQPTEGKVKEGGLRLGEMEQEAILAHGAALTVKERFDSDKSVFYICENCGELAIHNAFRKLKFCQSCGERTQISPVEMSYAFKLFLDELRSLNLKTTLKLKEKY